MCRTRLWRARGQSPVFRTRLQRARGEVQHVCTMKGDPSSGSYAEPLGTSTRDEPSAEGGGAPGGCGFIPGSAGPRKACSFLPKPIWLQRQGGEAEAMPGSWDPGGPGLWGSLVVLGGLLLFLALRPAPSHVWLRQPRLLALGPPILEVGPFLGPFAPAWSSGVTLDLFPPTFSQTLQGGVSDPGGSSPPPQGPHKVPTCSGLAQGRPS